MSIRFNQVSKSFGDRKVLDEISFKVIRGEIIFILGKSGMGKSVTLKQMIGVIAPDSGEIWVDEFEVSSLIPSRKTQVEIDQTLSLVRQRCGMVFQQPALLDSLTLYENIAFGLRTPQYHQKIGRQLSEDEIDVTVHHQLKLVHLSPDLLNLRPEEVSYGVQKRISIARTLAPSPDYLLFDEPTTGLDPLSTSEINQLIWELSRKLSITSIIVSHDMACALAIADEILFLDQGKIILTATPAQVVTSQIPLVVEFFRETKSLLPKDWQAKLKKYDSEEQT